MDLKDNESENNSSDLELDITLNEEKAETQQKETSEETDEVALAVEVAKTETELSKKDLDRKLKEFGEYDPKLDLSDYKLPNIDILPLPCSANKSMFGNL